jgi:hypothetical protein
LGHHHAWGGTANTTHWSRKSWGRLCKPLRNHSSSSSSSNTRPWGSGRSFCFGFFGRRGAFHREGDNGFTANQDQTKGPLFLPLFLLGLAGNLSELFRIANDQVHVFIKRHELANNDTTVLDGNPHPVIDKLKHLAAFGRHDGQTKRELRCLEINRESDDS